ncbi:MAG: site-2 protease family protein [Deltaproteobacteria bacterium]|nr:site-2 protease family protein [Deltaproteobacteria bacterium]
MNGSVSDIIQKIALFAPVFIFSLTFHEYGHAWSARRLGDDTAARMGRLTLNPMAHIDLFGTIIFPLVGLLFGFPLIGWANPVPINPLRFRRKYSMNKGMAITASAGPLANLLLALASSLILAALVVFIFSTGGKPGWIENYLVQVLRMGIELNVVLMVFNLIPVPPLDGSRILSWFLPEKYRYGYERLQQYGMLILYALLFTGAIEIFFIPAEWIMGLFDSLVQALVGMAL